MKYRQYVPVTIASDDKDAVVVARLKLEKALHELAMAMARTKGSAAVTADFSMKITEEAKKTGG